MPSDKLAEQVFEDENRHFQLTTPHAVVASKQCPIRIAQHHPGLPTPMIYPLQISLASPPPGSFEFTPEGYAKASYWTPENSFTYDDFWQPRFSHISQSEYEAELAEFRTRNAAKLEIVNGHYGDGSLRTLFPDRWRLAYASDKASSIVDGKKVPLYSQLKRTLFFKSVILGYGEGPIHKAAPSKEVAMFIKEHCASSARLKAIALRAYESVANTGGHGTWTSASPPIFLCLAAAKSSLDAMAAVLWALVKHELPKKPNRKTKALELFFPSMFDLLNKLRGENHSFQDQLEKLYKSSWYRKLQDARDKVIHRSASPVIHDKFGAGFDFDLGLFKEMRANKLNVGKPRVGMEKNTKRIHLDKIMKGFVTGLEKWEKQAARKLHKPWFPSFNTDGILMGIEFNDNNLLRDGSGPAHIITSHAKGGGSKFQFVGLHPFKRPS